MGVSRQRVLLTWALALVSSSAAPREAIAAEDCCASNPNFPGDCAAANRARVLCARFRSRFDGARDHFFLALPPSYDPSRPAPLFVFYRANAQGGRVFSDPRLYESVGRRYGALAVFHTNRCDEPCTGQNGPMNGAALDDAVELVDELVARFRISHVLLVGSSRGGVLALRLLARRPDRFAGVVAAVPALCMASDGGPPDCVGSYYEEATREIYAAARAGRYDDRLVRTVVGARDDNAAIVAGNRFLAGLLDGKRWYRQDLVPEGGHENFLSGQYAEKATGRFEWVGSTPVAPTLEADVRAFLAAHPHGAMTPSPGWTPPADPYLTDGMLRLSAGAVGAAPAPAPWWRGPAAWVAGHRKRVAAGGAVVGLVVGVALALRRRRRRRAS